MSAASNLEHFLVVGSLLFAVGLVGFLTRRNLILLMLSAETMLHGVSINLTAFGQYHKQHDGQIFTIFVLTVAACEAGLALALILTLYQRKHSLDVQLWSALGESDLMAPDSVEPPLPPIGPAAVPDPRLSVAGQMPAEGQAAAMVAAIESARGGTPGSRGGDKVAATSAK
jgi:NADH-quinone oxidoreductase subunit K